MADEKQAQVPQRMPDLETLYLRVRDNPLRVLDIRRADDRGADQRPLRTKQEVIDRELKRVYDAKTLQQIHEALEEAITNLRQLDVFEEIEALIDSEPEVGCALIASASLPFCCCWATSARMTACRRSKASLPSPGPFCRTCQMHAVW